MASTSTSHFMLLLICVSTLAIIGISQANGGESTYSTLPFSLIYPAAATNQGVTCPVPQNQCGTECDRRCSATSHKSACLLFCNKCCNTCLCVPPGTYGNKECCPCYNNWKNKEGGPKCP